MPRGGAALRVLQGAPGLGEAVLALTVVELRGAKPVLGRSVSPLSTPLHRPEAEGDKGHPC